MIKNLIRLSGILFFIVFLGGCSSSQSIPTNKRSLSDQIYTLMTLDEQYKQWENTPYRLGGNSYRGIDCSAFVMRVFAEGFTVHLPRTTVGQSKTGIRITKDQLQTGDLVFFKTGQGPNGYHVGIYVKEGHFIHASTSKGVTYSSLNNSYWKKVFWQARRV
ncbi:endopeptidase [Mergibacter septicus]|uniref:C40 family peptidase n=1 Tax=Mergibacter septicus TaxID=221402 RepID=UPI001C7689ED|nr:NlpC/P60 family protein [Mergibacter septicus]QDJ12862.1 endopeptidase [Mergibacter septicus]